MGVSLPALLGQEVGVNGNIRFTKPIDFNVDDDMRLIHAVISRQVAVLHTKSSVGAGAIIRLYVLNPAGPPLLIFDGVPYLDFTGLWSPDSSEKFGWPGFPSLKIAAFKGKRCISAGMVPMWNLVSICVALARYSVMNPSDPDGRIRDAIRSVLERHDRPQEPR